MRPESLVKMEDSAVKDVIEQCIRLDPSERYVLLSTIVLCLLDTRQL